MKYIMITPVKNEQKFISQTIESVINQTTLPSVWVIIDGGSRDKTREIVLEYAKKHPWIVLRHQSLFGLTSHMNVSIAMNEAYDYIIASGVSFDYVWAIDGDQVLESNVCDGVISQLELFKNIGVASGQTFNGNVPDIYPKGELPNKRVYRREALDAIGGFPVVKYSFDTVVLAKLRMKNFAVQTYPHYKIRNLREDSGIERNYYKSAVQFGKARWYLGYSFPLLVMGCGYLFLHGKYLKSIGVFNGWVGSLINNDVVIADAEVWEHFHHHRLNGILRGGAN